MVVGHVLKESESFRPNGSCKKPEYPKVESPMRTVPEKKRILLVGDVELFRKFSRRLLAKESRRRNFRIYRIVPTACIPAKMGKWCFDLVIVDGDLQNANEIVKELKKNARIPVIVGTSRGYIDSEKFEVEPDAIIENQFTASENRVIEHILRSKDHQIVD